jgi:uncharacterized protein (TIGR03067 family)
MNPSVMIISTIAAAVLSAGLFTSARGDDAASGRDERVRLSGTWTCVTAVIDGKTLSEAAARKLRLTLTADHYRTDRGDEVLFDSTYRIDLAHDPRHIDMVGTEGDLAGKEAPGIYRLESDGAVLKVCYVMPGRPRPTKFESAAGSGAYLVTWKRETSSKDR